MVSNQNKGYLDYMLGENTLKVVRAWNVLPREVVKHYLESLFKSNQQHSLLRRKSPLVCQYEL